MKEYRCIKELQLECYDDDGFIIENKMSIVSVGEIFEMEDTQHRLVGGKDTVRLSNDRQWMEILPETLSECFECMEAADV